MQTPHEIFLKSWIIGSIVSKCLHESGLPLSCQRSPRSLFSYPHFTMGQQTFHEPCSKMQKPRQSLIDYIWVLMDPGIVFVSFMDPNILLFFQWICLNWPPRELFFHKVMNFQKYMLNFSNTKDRPFSNASSLDTQKDKRTKDRPFLDTSSLAKKIRGPKTDPSPIPVV